MYTVLVVVQVLVAVALVGLILLQHGKGADAGAAFGSGASGTVFGSRGSANFLSRATAWLATVFFGVSLALAYLVHGQKEVTSVVDRAQPAATVPATATPAVPAETLPAAPAAPAPEPKQEAPKVPE
ncbi:MAG TPA: preprotein translocase subunit SecG [Solimonas sp.]|nr:preprotein translocase subunit SecG [Solimonas sp.]